jgi:tRNA1Val (adenine37-N6)-methyltransferase
MKVGTDGVLLGAWAHGKQASRILDIGTGTGLIALMLAQRFAAPIDALEIDPTACKEAQQNVEASPWSERITIINRAIQKYAVTCSHRYDLIVANPPFFQQSLKAATAGRTQARHTYNLPVEELFASVVQLLAAGGAFEVIIPAESLAQYKQLATQYQLFNNRLLWVKPTPQKAPKRVLCRFSFTQSSLHEDILIIESGGRHIYSEEYLKLTRDYYLGF